MTRGPSHGLRRAAVWRDKRCHNRPIGWKVIADGCRRLGAMLTSMIAIDGSTAKAGGQLLLTAARDFASATGRLVSRRERPRGRSNTTACSSHLTAFQAATRERRCAGEATAAENSRTRRFRRATIRGGYYHSSVGSAGKARHWGGFGFFFFSASLSFLLFFWPVPLFSLPLSCFPPTPLAASFRLPARVFLSRLALASSALEAELIATGLLPPRAVGVSPPRYSRPHASHG